MTNSDFDRVIDSIREDSGTPSEALEAAARVRDRIEGGTEAARLESCADFRTLFPSYRAHKLMEARRMLVEDHLHSCVACRKEYEGRRPQVIPITRDRRVLPWAMAAAAVLAVGIAIPFVLDLTLAPSGPRATVALVDGELYRVSDQGSTRLSRRRIHWRRRGNPDGSEFASRGPLTRRVDGRNGGKKRSAAIGRRARPLGSFGTRGGDD